MPQQIIAFARSLRTLAPLLVVCAALGLQPAMAATLRVGPGKTFSTIAAAVTAAEAGDTIEIDAGTYPNETFRLDKDNVTLRGIGGRAHLMWGTGNYLTNTATIGNGKAIIVVGAANATLENLEFSGAKVAAENGAGIRYEGGNLTIRGSHFHDNENGILGQGGAANTLLIEHSIFERNGYCPPACAHNLYIGNMGTLVFRFNKSIDSKEGHTLKSRAKVNEVVGNYFSTRNSDGSYEAEFPNGGTVYFIGNVVEQGSDSGNSAMLSYGAEGVTNPAPALHVVNNTFSNLKGSGTFITAAGAPALTVRNNVFSGGGAIGVPADASNRVLPATTFVNSTAGDYRLVPGSAAIDAGSDPGSAGAFDLRPHWEYREPAGKWARSLAGAAIDAGAFEYLPPAGARPFDIDGDGQVRALTDGLLLIRYLFGVRGAALIAGAVAPGAPRATAEAIEAHIAAQLP